MKNLIILHGKPTEERYNNPEIPKPHEANWLPWIGEQLSTENVSVSIPAMPKPYLPNYMAWQKTFEMERIDEFTALVGHSTGADFILRWLSDHRDVALERVVLVAPWHDEAGKYGDFSEYQLDYCMAKRIGKIVVMNSRDDSDAIQENAHNIVNNLASAQLVELDGFGHFMLGNNMTTKEFPELMKELS